MSNVVPFKSAAERGKHLRRHQCLEKELSLPSPLMTASMSDRHRHVASETPSTRHISANAQPRSPLVGLTIVAGAILVYTLVTFHLVGQPHYSARANLLPSIIVQN
jgi:hypothetical protein